MKYQTCLNQTQNVSYFLLQLFYIFIYSASISFLIFVYVFLLRKRSGEIIRQAVRRLSFHDSQPMFRRVVTFSNVGHSGGFYLRLGAIGNKRFKAIERQSMKVHMTNNKKSRRFLFWHFYWKLMVKIGSQIKNPKYLVLPIHELRSIYHNGGVKVSFF